MTNNTRIFGWLLYFWLVACVANVNGQNLSWNQNCSKATFKDRLSQSDDTQFFVIDIEKKSKLPAFDHDLVADFLSKSLKNPSVANRLPISRVEFVNGSDNLILLTANKTFEWSPAEQKLSEVDFQPEGKLFWPPRRSTNSSESAEIVFDNQLSKRIKIYWLSTDGSERGYGTVPPNSRRPMSTYAGHTWLIKDDNSKKLACYESQPNDVVTISEAALAQIAENKLAIEKENSDPRSESPSPPAWSATVKNHNLYVRATKANKKNRDTDELIQLSKNADAANTFLRNPNTKQSEGNGRTSAFFGPNNKFVVAYQRVPFETRQIHFVEAAPKDQLQPRLHQFGYRKPGDELPQKSVHLFDIEQQTEIKISNDLFPTPYALEFVKWSGTGDEFYLSYNQRGHQIVRLLAVSVSDGSVRIVKENTSETFVHYSNGGKSFTEWIDDDQLLWASEKSGWNHLYLSEISTGKLLNAVTKGNWNVRRVHEVDIANQCVWFDAVGVYPEQDPYHVHFCRVNLDGSDFKILTQGDGTHSISFEQGKRFIVDKWSRIDLAPVRELRDALTGELVCELDRGNVEAHFPQRSPPQRFAAPGRDGKTRIWGIIHFPIDFDSTKKYPVVENIYAGPHDHHVPKSFQTGFGHQHQIADAGFIVVQIDGMGTAWRSKAFHDVCYKNLKDAGFPDRIAWMKAAAKQFPQMDVERVGIYGGSAGGQNAMAALLWHNDFYDVAVADCGCHDNRMDKIWWNEQWMGYPIDESYAANSNVDNAHLLKGELMLTVGEKDRNVDPASTVQVVDALIRADKDFEFVLIPGGGHGIGESKWAARKRVNFFVRHLKEN